MGRYKNTYNFDEFTDENQKKEVQRLHAQATLASDLEKEALEYLKIPENSNIVDIGCGPGFVTAQIAENNPTCSVSGLDTSEELLAVANDFTYKYQENLNFKLADAYNTKFANDSVDFIYNRLIYQHIEHPVDALTEAKRILKPRGRICILDIDDQMQIFYPELPSFPKLQKIAGENQQEYGGDRLIGRKLPSLLKEAGYKNIRCLIRGVTTLDIGFEAFFNIVVSFKAQIVGEKGDQLVEQIRKEVQELNQEPFGIISVLVVTGEA
ncbi:MAG: methyltransferase domain-containing protein [Desulfobacter sp.]